MLNTYHRLNLHIYASDRTVVRAALRKIKRKARHDRALRKLRHEWLREMLAYHAKARNLAQTFRL
jgi:hypothetical protein